MKGALSSVYRSVKDIVKKAVNRGAANNAMSSRHHRLTESHEAAQNIVGCVMKTLTFTAPNTKLVKDMLK